MTSILQQDNSTVMPFHLCVYFRRPSPASAVVTCQTEQKTRQKMRKNI